MKLQEHQAKLLLARHGVPVAEGLLATTSAEAAQVATHFGQPVMVKAQVRLGDRNRAGGVRLAQTAREASDFAAEMLHTGLEGMEVQSVLIEPALTVWQELYIGITIDRSIRSAVLLCSAVGGSGVESRAWQDPDQFLRLPIDPYLGLRKYQLADVAGTLELARELWFPFTNIGQAMYKVFIASDATLVEINPLGITPQGLVALDAKIEVDDNALFRHPELLTFLDGDHDGQLEQKAQALGLNYVQLEGEIACVVNGGGLAMATMDAIALAGGRAANFVDIGGQADAEKVAAGLEIALADKQVRAIIVNVFGGITRADDVAQGILDFIKEYGFKVPLAVRLAGTMATNATNLLTNQPGVRLATSLRDVAEKAVGLVNEVLV